MELWDITTDPYQRLANAIILKAVKDYRLALRRLLERPDSLKALGVKTECERFFMSKYFRNLTELDGVELMERLLEEVIDDYI